MNARQSRPLTPTPSVSPGASAASFGEEHDRQPHRLGELEEPVLLAMVLGALGAGEDGVVVGDRDHLRGAPGEHVSVHRADAPDHPVGRCLLDQFLDTAPPSLSGDHDRPVLDERILVDEIGDVLARGASPHLPPTRHGIARVLVEPHRVARDGLREVGADRGRVDRRGCLDCDRLDVGGRQPHHGLARRQRLPDRHEHRVDSAALGCVDRVVHLHRLDQHQLLPRAHEIAALDVDRDDRPLHRRRHGRVARRHRVELPIDSTVAVTPGTTLHPVSDPTTRATSSSSRSPAGRSRSRTRTRCSFPRAATRSSTWSASTSASATP
jgi:hypothetical protein